MSKMAAQLELTLQRAKQLHANDQTRHKRHVLQEYRAARGEDNMLYVSVVGLDLAMRELGHASYQAVRELSPAGKKALYDRIDVLYAHAASNTGKFLGAATVGVLGYVLYPVIKVLVTSNGSQVALFSAAMLDTNTTTREGMTTEEITESVEYWMPKYVLMVVRGIGVSYAKTLYNEMQRVLQKIKETTGALSGVDALVACLMMVAAVVPIATYAMVLLRVIMTIGVKLEHVVADLLVLVAKVPGTFARVCQEFDYIYAVSAGDDARKLAGALGAAKGGDWQVPGLVASNLKMLTAAFGDGTMQDAVWAGAGSFVDLGLQALGMQGGATEQFADSFGTLVNLTDQSTGKWATGDVRAGFPRVHAACILSNEIGQMSQARIVRDLALGMLVLLATGQLPIGAARPAMTQAIETLRHEARRVRARWRGTVAVGTGALWLVAMQGPNWLVKLWNEVQDVPGAEYASRLKDVVAGAMLTGTPIMNDEKRQAAVTNTWKNLTRTVGPMMDMDLQPGSLGDNLLVAFFLLSAWVFIEGVRQMWRVVNHGYTMVYVDRTLPTQSRL